MTLSNNSRCSRQTAVDSSLGYPADTGVSLDELLGFTKQEAKALLDNFRQRQPQQTGVMEFILTGSPATDFVKAAKKWPADVIVIGSHGGRAVPRVLLGSVAEGVMRHAPCPVLVIRAKE